MVLPKQFKFKFKNFNHPTRGNFVSKWSVRWMIIVDAVVAFTLNVKTTFVYRLLDLGDVLPRQHLAWHNRDDCRSWCYLHRYNARLQFCIHLHCCVREYLWNTEYLETMDHCRWCPVRTYEISKCLIWTKTVYSAFPSPTPPSNPPPPPHLSGLNKNNK